MYFGCIRVVCLAVFGKSLVHMMLVIDGKSRGLYKPLKTVDHGCLAKTVSMITETVIICCALGQWSLTHGTPMFCEPLSKHNFFARQPHSMGALTALYERLVPKWEKLGTSGFAISLSTAYYFNMSYFPRSFDNSQLLSLSLG